MAASPTPPRPRRAAVRLTGCGQGAQGLSAEDSVDPAEAATREAVRGQIDRAGPQPGSAGGERAGGIGNHLMALQDSEEEEELGRQQAREARKNSTRKQRRREARALPL